MLKYILKRIFWMFIALWVMMTIIFIAVRMIPNGLIDPKLPEATKQAITNAYGLNDSIIQQYFTFLKNMLTLNFGTSWKLAPGTEVMVYLVPKLKLSARIGFYALSFGAIVGLTFGSIAALFRNKWQDHALTTLAIVGIALPSFVFASLLHYIFTIKFSIFPPAFDSDMWTSYILPSLGLSVFVIASLTRYMRSELIEVNSSDYILLAKAKGVKQRDVVIKHSIRNALIPVVTIMGPLALAVMTGGLVIEKIFSVPGIGATMVNAANTGDIPVVTALAFILGLAYMTIILLIDISYGLIDPRIRVHGKADE